MTLTPKLKKDAARWISRGMCAFEDCEAEIEWGSSDQDGKDENVRFIEPWGCAAGHEGTRVFIVEAVEAVDPTGEPVYANLRPEVQDYAERIEKALRKHDARRGDTWRGMSSRWLLDRLREELNELQRAAIHNADGLVPAADVAKEAADVGAFAMFIAANAQRKTEEKPPA